MVLQVEKSELHKTGALRRWWTSCSCVNGAAKSVGMHAQQGETAEVEAM